MNAHESLASFEAAVKGTRKAVPAARAVAYVRVSTDEQALSPQAQEASIRDYAVRARLEVVAVFSDVGVSGAAPLDERPGLEAALDAVREQGATVLLVAKRDRLARDVARALFVEKLVERNGGSVQSADGVAGGVSPEDKLLRTIMDAMGEYERALIRSRTKAALAEKARRGERVGAAPFGFKIVGDLRVEESVGGSVRVRSKGGKLEPHPEEQRAIARILELRKLGWSAEDIVGHITRDGHKSRGERWHSTTVKRILKRHGKDLDHGTA